MLFLGNTAWDSEYFYTLSSREGKEFGQKLGQEAGLVFWLCSVFLLWGRAGVLPLDSHEVARDLGTQLSAPHFAVPHSLTQTQEAACRLQEGSPGRGVF